MSPAGRFAIALSFFGLLGTASIAAPLDAGVFGSVAIPSKNFPAMERWRPIVQEISRCSREECLEPDSAIDGILESAHGKSTAAQLQLVNGGINGFVRYRKDSSISDTDIWEAPANTAKTAAGDCEDIAILKMAALARLGIPLETMSIVVLRIPSQNAYHAVLAVRTDEGFQILDNLTDDIEADLAVEGYVPLYSLSSDGGWLHGTRSPAPRSS